MTAGEKVEWNRWQHEQASRASHIRSPPDAAIEVKACAWETVGELISVHELGFRVTDQVKDRKLIRSECLEFAE